MDQVTYIFRSGGWEYAVSATSGRPGGIPADELSDYESHEITLLSPTGETFTLR